MFDLSNFCETCSYCYDGLPRQIFVCNCNESLCENHLELHCQKFNCDILYSFTENKNKTEHDKRPIKVEDHKNHNPNQIQDLEDRINIRIVNKVIRNNLNKECLHIYSSKNVHKEINEKDLKCADCDLTENLWICLDCGFIGCGRVQSGIKGNGHALAHYKNNCIENDKIKTHAQTILISSISNEDLDMSKAETFCYICEDFVQNPFKINIKYFNLNCKNFNDLIENEDQKTKSDPSCLTGIINESQNCYISPVLHLFSLITDGIDLNEHFLFCEMSPSLCLMCQFIKVLNRLRQKEGELIKISGFLKTVFNYKNFTNTKQEDCCEFLEFLIDKIKFYENCGLIPMISKYFSFEICNEMKCGKCDYKNTISYNNDILYVPFAKKLKNSFLEYFKENEGDCNCGEKLKIKAKFTKVAPYIIVTCMRYKFEDAKSIKIDDKIEVEDINIEDFGINSKCILSVNGSITHKGDETECGHYTWWVKDKTGYFTVNDDLITNAKKEGCYDGTIFLYSKQ